MGIDSPAPPARDDMQPCAVPMTELLRRLPSDARYVWTEVHGLKATHYVPVGRYSHEAAALIDALSFANAAKDMQIAALNAALRAARGDGK